MKTFREFVSEVAKPISGAEINFLNKHVVVVLDYPIDVEDQFTGGDISQFTRLPDYKKGEDEKAYDSVVSPEPKPEDEVVDGEVKRHKKLEIIKKIIDDNDISEEAIAVLEQLSLENLEFAMENNINVVEFVEKYTA